MEEIEIINKALWALKKETGVTAALRPGVYGRGAACEDMINVTLPGQSGGLTYCPNIKKKLTKPMLGTLGRTAGKRSPKELLVTEYVSIPMAENLKALDIEFVDTAGNVYLNNLPLYIYIKGNKQPMGVRQITGPRAFNGAGLKLILALLANPELVGKTVREIAEYAGVALGTINTVFNDLKRRQYLVEMPGKQRCLVNKEKLIQQWAVAYPELLRPKLILGRYTTDNKRWWEEAVLPNLVRWGGEPAAAMMTRYLKPEEITIYAPELPTQLLLKHQLRRDLDGEVTIYKTFWQQHAQVVGETRDLVHPLVVYADLLATADSRNIETAKKLYEEKIVRYF